MESVLNLIMDKIKPSLTRTCLIDFQSVGSTPFNNKHTDSSASFTGAGGLAIDLTSVKFCFLIDCTAKTTFRLFKGEG